MTGPIAPPRTVVDELLRRALAEDLGRSGDLTTEAIISADAATRAVVVAREAGRIAGLDASLRTFGLLDDRVVVRALVADSDTVAAGTVLGELEGPTRAILTGERTCLNLLGHLSGIATQVADVVALVDGTGARIIDTRKTTAGLRALEKYAVRCGGGGNHRMGLDDAVLIKDNHLAAAGSIAAAVGAARAHAGHLIKIEVEVDTLDQLREALGAGVDLVLLDNMDPDTLQTAVDIAGGRCLLEASGGITPDNVRAVAETGVDLISMGWLTHSAPSLDVALDLAAADD